MLFIVNLFLCILHTSIGQVVNSNWDLAVTTDDQIVFLTNDGGRLPSSILFRQLKALTYDSATEKFIVSDMNQENDTIYSVSLEENDRIKRPIIENLTDDIQSLALDPSTNILYWADSIHRLINYISYNTPSTKSGIFIELDEEEPQHLVIHSCKRYMFFTNSLLSKPSINRINLDTKKHEILIDSNLLTPVGITIDYIANRIYWSDWGPGIYYRIESSNLDGGDRRSLISDTYHEPFGLAVDNKYIYWTDINNNALWKAYKENYGFNKNYIEKVKNFEEKPRGLINKYLGFAGTPSCEDIVQLKKEFEKLTEEHSATCLNSEQKACDDSDYGCFNNDCEQGKKERSRYHSSEEL